MYFSWSLHDSHASGTQPLNRQYGGRILHQIQPQQFGSKKFNIVSVCLSLTELESELGYFATQILDLLNVAVYKEKQEQNSADNLLLIDKYSILLTSVAQKFFGVLLVQKLETSIRTSVEDAIQKIAILLYNVAKRVSYASSPGASSERDKKSVSSEDADIIPGNASKPAEERMKLSQPVNPKQQTVETETVHEPLNVATIDLENFSDDDLQQLLCRFTDLTVTQQSELLMHLLRQISKKD